MQLRHVEARKIKKLLNLLDLLHKHRNILWHLNSKIVSGSERVVENYKNGVLTAWHYELDSRLNEFWGQYRYVSIDSIQLINFHDNASSNLRWINMEQKLLKVIQLYDLFL